MTNYTIASNLDIVNLKISDGAYRCYMLLQSMAYGDKIQIYPSERYIAAALGRSVRTVQRYLKELVKNGLLSIRRRGSISNLYTLLQKKTQQTVEKVKDSIKRVYSASKTNKTYNQKQSTFNNFKQRSYNFSSLENMLLGKRAYNPEELYNQLE